MMKIGDDVCHEGHILLMEKELGRLKNFKIEKNSKNLKSLKQGLGGSSRLQNVKGIGNKWVHRYLTISDDKKHLTLSPTDDADKLHKDVKYTIIKGKRARLALLSQFLKILIIL